MLDSLAACARFPDDSCNFALTAADATEAVAAEEETSNMLEKRQELFTLFKNTAKLAPKEAYAFVGMQLQGVVSRSKADWQVCLPIHNSSNDQCRFASCGQALLGLASLRPGPTRACQSAARPH